MFVFVWYCFNLATSEVWLMLISHPPLKMHLGADKKPPSSKLVINSTDIPPVSDQNIRSLWKRQSKWRLKCSLEPAHPQSIISYCCVRGVRLVVVAHTHLRSEDAVKPFAVRRFQISSGRPHLCLNHRLFQWWWIIASNHLDSHVARSSLQELHVWVKTTPPPHHHHH